MNLSFLVKKKMIERLLLMFFLPLLSSCSASQSPIVENIDPPVFPKEFSSIPEQTENPQLLALLSVEEKVKNISVGRKDPFLPPQFKGTQLFVPDSFKYHGHIFSKDIFYAFVSYDDKRGTIKQGDIGGESTDLLPNGWSILSLNADKQVLSLGFEDRSVDIELFPEK